jgi:putative Mg2+ transporter-C (MgtC) family protein
MQLGLVFGDIYPHTLAEIAWDVINLGVAYVLAVPIGWDQEHETHRAGIRTFPIVAIASCALTIVGRQLGGSTADAESRILQGLITGIGFVGGGAILKDKGRVSGTATAASIWSIGIIGAAVGLRIYHVAIALALVNFITLRILHPWRSALATDEQANNRTLQPPA